MGNELSQLNPEIAGVSHCLTEFENDLVASGFPMCSYSAQRQAPASQSIGMEWWIDISLSLVVLPVSTPHVTSRGGTHVSNASVHGFSSDKQQ